MAKQRCLADGGKHQWRYTIVDGVRTMRVCQKCGATDRNEEGRWRRSRSTRWVPLMPSERGGA